MKSKRLIRKQDGAAAVEFAIILPLFLLFIFGIVEWSLYLFNEHIITDASRRGARRGVVQVVPRVTETEIRAKVLEYTGNHLVTFGTQNTPSVTVPATCVTFGNDLEVDVTYDYHFMVLPAFTAGKVSPSKTITARTVMKCE
jgi:Flp pilus assembly protein TadG